MKKKHHEPKSERKKPSPSQVTVKHLRHDIQEAKKGIREDRELMKKLK